MLLPLFDDNATPAPAAVAHDGTWIGMLKALADEYPHIGVPRAVIGLDPPHSLLPAKEVQKIATLPNTPQVVADALWRFVVAQARSQRGGWYLYAISAADKLLRQAALRFASTDAPPEIIWETHTNIVAEFIIAMHRPRVNLDRPRVVERLVEQAHYYVRTRARPERRAIRLETITGDLDAIAYYDTIANLRLAGPPDGHPDLVLARLVRESGGRLSAEDADLVARTLFERDEHGRRKTIEVAAAELGIKVSAAPMRVSRAKRLIKQLLPTRRTRRASLTRPPATSPADAPAAVGAASPDTAPAP